MSAPEFMQYACWLAYALLGVAVAFTIIRLAAGPTLADRILCLDTVSLLAASGIGVFALESSIYAYVDLSIAIALTGCLSTAAFARYLLSRKLGANS
ncbi:MAG TPA: monovalent cation/H+ antiporter complex subunit F [Devosia sp.]|nr:monovalent cation/H+ antiporter complex subunit F [Devosia sp.]